jgi:uncharacterized protein YecE (DUF72 family)
MKKLKDAADPLQRVIEHASGLGGNLGPILYQLPPNWRPDLARLRDFIEILPRDLRHAMEFRNPGWLVDEVFDMLAEHQIGYCIMSAPDLPRVMKVTAPFAYIRMHNGGDDLDGNYEDPQLEWWAEQIKSLLADADVYVYFNNDYKGYAVSNALRLSEMVGTLAGR